MTAPQQPTNQEQIQTQKKNGRKRSIAYLQKLASLPKENRRKTFIEFKRGRGAPEKLNEQQLIDIFENLGRLGITSGRSIAGVIGVSHDTINRYLRSKPGLSAALERGKERGGQMLKNKAFKMAYQGKEDSKVTAEMVKYVLLNISDWKPSDSGFGGINNVERMQLNIYLPEVEPEPKNEKKS